jgi:DUF971 family protein
VTGAPRPSEIRLKAGRTVLEVTFDDGQHFALPAELLRVESPSAEVQGHGPGQKTIVTGKADITIRAVEPVGHYAVRLVFSDGHDTGLFSWPYLLKLGREGEALMRAYRAAVGGAG